MPRFYWDFTMAHKEAARGQTPFTPAISVFYGLREALRLFNDEGLQTVLARHRRIGAYTREGVKKLGLRLVPVDERRASDTVTAFWLPDGMKDSDVMERLRLEYGVVLAGGQGDLTGRILRIGHLGLVDESDIDQVFDALRHVLSGTTAARL
jgi:aspartate aminotransferase-like enzyme